jgi:hypothetical protein
VRGRSRVREIDQSLSVDGRTELQVAKMYTAHHVRLLAELSERHHPIPISIFVNIDLVLTVSINLDLLDLYLDTLLT